MRLQSVRTAFVATLAVLVTSLAPGSASATAIGEEGCTPGYWKNHTDNWLETEEGDISYATDERFGDVFDVDYDVTLLDALQGGGGNGLAGAKRILARAATAAILNAAHEGLGYPLSRWNDTDEGPAIIASVQDAWDSGSRTELLDLAAYFDSLNNWGCPLN